MNNRNARTCTILHRLNSLFSGHNYDCIVGRLIQCGNAWSSLYAFHLRSKWIDWYQRPIKVPDEMPKHFVAPLATRRRCSNDGNAARPERKIKQNAAGGRVDFRTITHGIAQSMLTRNWTNLLVGRSSALPPYSMASDQCARRERKCPKSCFCALFRKANFGVWPCG